MHGFLAVMAAITLLACGVGTEPAATQLNPPVVLFISRTELSLIVGDEARIVAQAFNARGETTAASIEWSSADPAVATVRRSDGTVTAIAAGTTTVTATAGTLSATAAVLVRLPNPPPTITEVSPNLGSTGGGTPLQIYGTGFQSASVTIGGIKVQGRFDFRNPSTAIYLDAPAHAAGTVDVIATNLSGQADTLAGGYTYASPQSFDFNGNWGGWDDAGVHVWIKFTIKDNVLVSVSCEDTILTFSTPPSVSNGEFSFSRPDGVSVTGRIVAATIAVGTINLPPCASLRWGAEKRGSP